MIEPAVSEVEELRELLREANERASFYRGLLIGCRRALGNRKCCPQRCNCHECQETSDDVIALMDEYGIRDEEFAKSA